VSARLSAALRVLFGLVAIVAFAGCAHLVVLRDPLTANEHNDLGVAYESQGKIELARKEYRKSVRMDPGHARTWVNLGNADAAGGRWRDAERSYRRALVLDAADADAMNNLAVALHEQGRRGQEARELARRAVAMGGARDSVYRATLDELESSERSANGPDRRSRR
jgi:Flp pilus assembly protein TadD